MMLYTCIKGTLNYVFEKCNFSRDIFTRTMQMRIEPGWTLTEPKSLP